ncbi:hypothetical protein QEH42_gp216 [Microbacterium phage Pumpernickel]|uniref:Uncharacterized protein n=1 Tax=Microbacterium phage Pumpernickel TaxID=2885983 RepID=A0AAE8YA25_9CAUD|nr:hypothetical protein QEH42_gp216 [Microbacterium phage Pumpernickel]UDL16002.1 hypothetical protein SEA_PUMPERNICKEL_252 [Microbacterium phage Pumpernickel]
MSLDNGEGMPKPSHVGQPGPLGGYGVGWQGSQIDFEVKNTVKPYEATAWDEDVCVASFTTRSRLVLFIRLWVWHWKFNRRSRKA